MEEKRNGWKLLGTATTIFVVWLIFFLLSFTFLTNVFEHPSAFFGNKLTDENYQYFALVTAYIVIGTLIAYISYLLLSSKARSVLLARDSTKWLALSREQFRRLYDGAPIPYLILDSKGIIHDPNTAALRFFGVTPEEINGKDLFTLFSDEDEMQTSRLTQLYRSGVPVDREEIRIATKSGEEKWVLISIFDIKNPLDKTNAGLASLFDISEQKKLDLAKTQFLSLASHQLRSPIASTKWFVDMLRSGELGQLTDKQADYLTRLSDVNHDMIDLVDTLLNVSRIEIGSLTIEKTSTNVPELCRSILLELGPQIEKKKLRIEEQYNGLFENIESDPKLLRIIIHNLISNAVKYTPDEGDVTILLEESGGERRITVTDSGYGIPDAEKSLIFSKLFRASNVKAISSSQGTGLGLYLVQSLVETLGGKISFVSEENKGSSFTITLS